MKLVTLLLTILVLGGCSSDKKTEDFLFTTVDPEMSKLDFRNELTETNALNILDYLYFYNGGGVAIGDINNDGLVDIYLTGNQVKNKLFLNKGNMEFEDITQAAGVAGTSSWNTGVTMVDINGDGFLDIYVCAVVGINGLRGHNELFINKGDGTFSEEAEQYGLDFKNYSSNAAFFDYDNDGDLDMYLLNHAVHTVNAYGPASIRNQRIEESGDKLLKNENGKFIDVSEEAGIYGGANGYGLGLATADFNNDGYTDIYVSNDFHEDDYYYINNGDGTFTEDLKNKFGHISRFSMGSDVADVNQDGFMDLLTLDMLPQEEKVLKASMGDDPLDLHNMKIERFAYHHQYTRNMLQINQGGNYFQEMGLYSNLAATDWSWSPLFADYNLDGKQDVFIATGIPRRPNDLDYIKYVSSEQIRQKINTTKLVDQKALNMMPSGNVHNYILKGEENLRFSDQSAHWMKPDSIISTGAAWGDLDNDGDLDLVTNNINHPASIYRNTSAAGSNNYLKIQLKYRPSNSFGTGTKIISWKDGTMQYKQLYTSRGFQSSSEPLIHFGYEQADNIDSLIVIWPDNRVEKITEVAVNQTLVLSPGSNLNPVDYQLLFPQKQPLFEKSPSIHGMDFKHEENRYIDFNRQKLIPYQISDRGPAVVVKDLNGDGLQDIFFGGAKHQSATIYYQNEIGFTKKKFASIYLDSLTEDIAAVIEDFNRDGKNDIFAVSGGGEFSGTHEALQDRMYINDGTNFVKQTLPPIFENGSVVKTFDFDKDGYVDIFVGAGAVSSDFGKIPQSYLLKNSSGKWSVVETSVLQQLGMVTDAVWHDFDSDGWTDLIVVGEWMGPKFFKNHDGVLTEVTDTVLSESYSGLWQTILPFDINQDGKMDYLLGNWGLNTRLKASRENPLKLYYDDFDNNGSTETLLAYEKDGRYYTAAGLDELTSQLAYLKKKFPTYKKFAGSPIEEIFDKGELENAKLLTVSTLASGYLLNMDGKFTFKPFDAPLQVAPLRAFLPYDFDNDGKEEVLIAGNYFGTTPYHGRLDGLAGNLIDSDGSIIEGKDLGLNFTQKATKSLDLIRIKNTNYLMVTFNNDTPEFYKIAH